MFTARRRRKEQEVFARQEAEDGFVCPGQDDRRRANEVCEEDG
jgi:hypothetical protein